MNEPVNYSPADLAGQFDLVVVTIYNASLAQQIKSMNPKAKVLLYRTISNVHSGEGEWATINSRESWFMHDPSGQRTSNGGDSYMMDIRNPEYRAYQVQHVTDLLNSNGLDGVFWDGAIGTLDLFTLNPGPDPTAGSTWHNDLRTFIKELKQALGSKLLITNGTQPYDTGIADADDTDYLPYLDGTMMEGFAHAPWYSATETISNWPYQQRMAKRNAAAGKFFHAYGGIDYNSNPSAAQKRQWQVFTYASALLCADEGQHIYYQWSPWQFDKTAMFAELTAPIGTPLGPAYSTDGVVTQRDFTGGKVIVNPNWETVTVTLPIGLQSLDGSVSTSPNTSQQVQVGPWSALILFKQ